MDDIKYKVYIYNKNTHSLYNQGNNIIEEVRELKNE